jgi:hypothetical protein
MKTSDFFTGGRVAVALALVAACGACSSVDAILPSRGLDAQTIDGASSHSPPAKESDKIVRLPMNSEDLDCPEVEVEDGASTTRVGGPDNAAVRYQFDIVDTARECQPQGHEFSLKVGVSGRLLIGPAGSPGAYSTTLKVIVRREVDQKTAFEKTYKVEANTAGAVQAPYQIVTEPIVLPLTRPQLNNDYSIFVGFDTGRNVALERPRHRRKPRAAAAH